MALGDAGRLRAVVSPAVRRAGFELEDLTVTCVGRRAVMGAVVARGGGVASGAAAAVSRSIPAERDARGDEIRGDTAYTLEVTSPGIGRPLTRPRHFRR